MCILCDHLRNVEIWLVWHLKISRSKPYQYLNVMKIKYPTIFITFLSSLENYYKPDSSYVQILSVFLLRILYLCLLQIAFPVILRSASIEVVTIANYWLSKSDPLFPIKIRSRPLKGGARGIYLRRRRR